MNVAGAILAGGRASRFNGAHKCLLDLPSGETIVQRLLSEFAQAGIEETAICGGDLRAYAPHGVPVISDLSPGLGPLAGIESALAYFERRASAVLFVPGDFPLITAMEIESLHDAFCRSARPAVFAETAGFVRHPLCSVVHIRALTEVRLAVSDGRLSVIELWQRIGAEPVFFEIADRFADVDTPEEFAALLGAKPYFGGESIEKLYRG